jgi:hypothetical protein
MSSALADAIDASALDCATRELFIVEAVAGSSAHTHFISAGLPTTYYETIFIIIFCAHFFGNGNAGAEHGDR